MFISPITSITIFVLKRRCTHLPLTYSRNDGGQQEEEIGPLEASAPREDQPAASSMAAAAAEKEEVRTHNLLVRRLPS